MDTTLIILTLFEGLCAALWYSVFCRAVHTDDRCLMSVRFAYFCVSLIALFGMVWPFSPQGRMPDLMELALVAAAVLIQWVTAAHWRLGVPEDFLQFVHRPRRRRASDFSNINGGGI